MLTKIEAFAKLMEKKTNERMDKLGFTLYRYEMVIEYGRKYAKVIRTERCNKTGELYANSRSVAAFVDKQTGDIYKASSWKSPAKGVRGNVTFNDGAQALDDGGYVRYL